MGCDIHVHTEVKIDDRWHHYSVRHFERDYRIFAKMASVRNDNRGIIPIVMPRGLPDDISFLTQFNSALWGEDGHSHSWLGAEEICWLAEYGENLNPDRFWESSQFGYVFGNYFSTFHEYKGQENSGIPEQLQDVRFVFWFDN